MSFKDSKPCKVVCIAIIIFCTITGLLEGINSNYINSVAGVIQNTILAALSGLMVCFVFILPVYYICVELDKLLKKDKTPIKKDNKPTENKNIEIVQTEYKTKKTLFKIFVVNILPVTILTILFILSNFFDSTFGIFAAIGYGLGLPCYLFLLISQKYIY